MAEQQLPEVSDCYYLSMTCVVLGTSCVEMCRIRRRSGACAPLLLSICVPGLISWSGLGTLCRKCERGDPAAAKNDPRCFRQPNPVVVPTRNIAVANQLELLAMSSGGAAIGSSPGRLKFGFLGFDGAPKVNLAAAQLCAWSTELSRA